jgi:hypothetical protein
MFDAVLQQLRQRLIVASHQYLLTDKVLHLLFESRSFFANNPGNFYY